MVFFKQPSPPEFALGSLLFRKRKSLDRDDKAQIRQLARLAFELSEKLAARTRVLDVRIRRFSETIDPPKAAQAIRDSLGFSPDTPVYKLMPMLEKNGVLVLALPVEILKHDAFSLWSDGDLRLPVIVVSANRSGDHVRFSLAHELGHLVMHHPVVIGNAKTEDDVNRFASEFLLPEQAMRQEIIVPITLTHLAELKARWGVSMQALIMRALALELISKRQVKRLFMMLSAHGWRMKEPVPIPAEKPRRLRMMAELIYGATPNPNDLAGLVHAPAKLMQDILQSHAGRDDISMRPTSSQRPQDTPNAERHSIKNSDAHQVIELRTRGYHAKHSDS